MVCGLDLDQFEDQPAVMLVTIPDFGTHLHTVVELLLDQVSQLCVAQAVLVAKGPVRVGQEHLHQGVHGLLQFVLLQETVRGDGAHCGEYL